MADAFDLLLISSMNVLRRAAPSASANYGQPTPALPTTFASNVPCRFSTLGGGRETKYDKKSAINQFKVFMRPLAGLTEKDWFEKDGKKYNIISIDNPSGLDHHYEVKVEQILP